ncbi:MAG TPA: alanine--tRNA ligase [Gaiella sp.]
MRTTAELREGFLSFFEARDHMRFPSWSLIPPPEDPSTLFVSAGMQPLKPYFSGAKEPPAPRFTTVQKCLRAGGKDTDLDEVGLTARHASMFEMLGNFSFGDYFKDGAVDYAWEFVTETMGFDPDRLWATVFAGDPVLGLGEDEVAVHAWQRKGIPRERIVPFPRSDNFWGPAGETGPCGPCSELHYDRGEEYGCGRPECGPNCDRCDRYIEFWNLVFMEFDLAADGSLTPLPKQNIDTGLGLERGAMLLQGVDSIFDTDGFRLIMDWIERESGVAYGSSPTATKAHRVLCDHGRGATFLIAEGVTPSNEGRGYVLRRLIRRSVVQARRIGLPAVYPLPAIVVKQVGPWYPEVVEAAEEIERIVRQEEERFRETLERGMREFETLESAADITAEDAFRLAATYGFPIELTVELARERGQRVDVDGYRAEMERHKEISRGTGERGTMQAAADFAAAAGFSTDFVGYTKTEVLTQIGALEDVGDGTFLAKLRESPFYPAGGGQVTDTGYIERDDGSGLRADLVEAHRLGDDQVLVLRGSGFAAGDRVKAVVSWRTRFPTMANHTATHLMHQALRDVLGGHVKQAGSAVRPDKLRFDFTHDQPLTPAEREEVERRVNERIFEGRPVVTFETPIDEARRLGAMMLFGEKYGDIVRVVQVPGYSTELCGGTHVRTTAEIGAFAILSESSVGSGARRIEAVTSGEAYAYLHARARELDEVREEIETLRKELRRRPAAGASSDPQASVRAQNGVNVVVQAVDGFAGDALLELSDRFKQRHAPAAVVLGTVDEGSVQLVANFDPSVAERVSADDVVRSAAALVGGGGGGRPTMARAGGKDAARLPDALAEAERLIVAAL